MACLVFDIETSSLPPEHFDEAQLEYLLRPAERMPTDEAKVARRAEIQRQFSLWPMTAQVVCIGMLNADTARGQALYLSDDYEESPEGPLQLVPCMDESELLSNFWEIARRYEQVVTFNGRGFDVPFLYLRSALLNVPISRKDWLGYRYQCDPHCDLADQLTFYGVSGPEGASRRFNLDFYCKRFGIDSPKSHGITGMDVSNLVAEGRFRDIAQYCMRDVAATMELYKIWRERLGGIK